MSEPVLEFAATGVPLATGDIEAIAPLIGADPAVVHAVCDVESAGGGFQPDHRPKILFEAHQFWIETDGRFGRSNVSSPAWDRSLYGAAGAHQYARLQYAIALDRTAALKSASWGMFQIMGTNYAACGFDDVEAFVRAMMVGEKDHLAAFVSFCRKNRLDRFLREPPDFASFARGYNGPGQVGHYADSLAAAYRKWLSHPAAPAMPGPTSRATDPEVWHMPATLRLGSSGRLVMELQQRLIALGYDCGAAAADGSFGGATEDAVADFQKANKLDDDGVVGGKTWAAIEAVPVAA